MLQRRDVLWLVTATPNGFLKGRHVDGVLNNENVPTHARFRTGELRRNDDDQVGGAVRAIRVAISRR